MPMAETKITAQEIVALSKQEGFLAKQLYVIFTMPTNGLGPVMANIKAHLEFQTALEKQGIMFAAGPNWADDEKSWDGDGMVVIRAKSLAEAREIAERDPMHKNGARKFRIRPWLVNEGTVSVRLNFSKGSFEMM
ncbi:MAG TPA: YciI family protein [Trinickia sp.]|nr:YciI family protein [Trinickia sp.]